MSGQSSVPNSKKLAAGAVTVGAGALLLYLWKRYRIGQSPSSSPAQATKMSSSTSAASVPPSSASTADSKSAHPRWHDPPASKSARLTVNNSLTSSKQPFITIDPLQKQVKWYICGPTVYDSAHLGHARAYVTFDIMRRVLEQHFGYTVYYVMNITDIDDKIILRARQNHLFAEYEAKSPALPEVLEFGRKAYAAQIKSMEGTVADLEKKLAKCPPKDKKDLTTRVSEAKLKLNNVLEQQQNANKEVEKAKTDAAKLAVYLKVSKDVIAKSLDKEMGHTVTDQAIFQEHARYFEQEFMEDMESLGVKKPTVLTRVTEFVPQVVEFVQKIIANGFAYESNGSVYFDVKKFDASHDYAKLAPNFKNNAEALKDGEGALAAEAQDKRNPNDFALWKASKPGEPFWQSPWGKGRPGWHIECSVMASSHLGAQMDIHSGGVDLKFPHHDNELAQAEAHFDCQQWVNYFLHAGHLNIKDCKMSKSLKNFITIRKVLERATARQLRLLFLMSPWDTPMNYDEQTLQEARAKEKLFKEFFHNVRSTIRQEEQKGTAVRQAWTDREHALQAAQVAADNAIHKALCDNFDYPSALKELEGVVREVNKYLTNNGAPRALLLYRVASFVRKSLGVLGVTHEDEISFNFGTTSSGGNNKMEVLAPVLDVLATFRTNVRTLAQQGGDKASLLKLCDELRNKVLPPLGVRLEDKPDNPKAWKLEDDPKQLMKELELKEQQQAAKAKQKLRKSIASKEAELAKLKLSAQTAEQRLTADGYSQFDDKGVPAAKGGKELSKKALKKVTKLVAQYTKLHQTYLKRLDEDKDFLAKMQAKIDELKLKAQ